MQSLEIVSVNLWQILISLLNLCLLCWILKKFLFKPVTKVLNDRQSEIDARYEAAETARRDAEAEKTEYRERLSNAQREADSLVKSASENANRRSNEIMADAREKANGIVRRAQTDAALEKKKAAAEIRREIAGLSTELSGKVLGREVRESDHRALIDGFLREMGE